MGSRWACSLNRPTCCASEDETVVNFERFRMSNAEEIVKQPYVLSYQERF
jgi:hypothetical protein